MKKPITTIYCGTRLTSNDVVVVRDGRPLTPGPSQKIWNHSPDGFNWSYEGSGPAQLALAILLDYYGKDAPELRYHQDFKRKVVARFENDWTLTGERIEAVMTEIIADRETRTA